MITCNLMGGLGNQLFQIFTTISYAIKNGDSFCFAYSDFLGKRPTYWNTFLASLKIFTVSSFPEMHVIKENGFHYTELPPQFEGENTKLDGYFQSYKYFDAYWGTLCRLIKLEDQKKYISHKYNHNYDNLISIHFRFGDYKHLQHCHPLMTHEYYRNSVQHIIIKTDNEKLKILYFCEKEDDDAVQIIVDKLQQNFAECRFVKIDHGINDWEQVLMMSLCRHNIIANSSFSWWGAYFNSHEDKIVCYPDIWFGPALAYHNLKDMHPVEWSKITSV